jgi:uncharacterized protein (UPF0305 family)
MKSSALFIKLQKHMEKYKSKVKDNELSFNEEDMSIENIMSKYNLETYYEIINSSYGELDDEVNEDELKDLKNRIDNYFRLYAPDDEEFREFIKIISLYLIFIAKKPLHPPGIKFSNGTMVYKKDDIFYCTGKKVFIKVELSLCKYCIARIN